jgi:hypothetical protein
MQSNFNVLCKTERDAIVVPDIPLAAILSGAASRPAPRTQNRRRGLVVSLLAGASIVAVATAAEIWSGTHVALDTSGAMTLSRPAKGLVYKENPTADDISAAAHRAEFPVVLPAGLPEGTRFLKLIAGPNIVNVAYILPSAGRGSNTVVWISLADPRTLTGTPQKDTSALRVRLGNNTGKGSVVRWTVGGEAVILAADGKLASTLTPAELARIKAAMIAPSR